MNIKKTVNKVIESVTGKTTISVKNTTVINGKVIDSMSDDEAVKYAQEVNEKVESAMNKFNTAIKTAESVMDEAIADLDGVV